MHLYSSLLLLIITKITIKKHQNPRKQAGNMTPFVLVSLCRQMLLSRGYYLGLYILFQLFFNWVTLYCCKGNNKMQDYLNSFHTVLLGYSSPFIPEIKIQTRKYISHSTGSVLGSSHRASSFIFRLFYYVLKLYAVTS